MVMESATSTAKEKLLNESARQHHKCVVKPRKELQQS